MGGAVAACYGLAELDKLVESDDLQLFLAIHLTRYDVARFVTHFSELRPINGSIDIGDLLAVVDIDKTKYSKHVYKIFDQQQTGRIRLRQFILSLWNYCTLGEGSLVLFNFHIYDHDGSGVLRKKDIRQLMQEIYGSVQTPQHKRELEALEQDSDLDLEAFKSLTRRHPNLLFSAFNLQSQLRKRFMGEAFWQSAAGRRVELSRGEYVTMGAMMQLHLDQELYDKMVAAGAWKNDAVQKLQLQSDATDTSNTPRGRAMSDGSLFRNTTAATAATAHTPRSQPTSPAAAQRGKSPRRPQLSQLEVDFEEVDAATILAACPRCSPRSPSQNATSPTSAAVRSRSRSRSPLRLSTSATTASARATPDAAAASAKAPAGQRSPSRLSISALSTSPRHPSSPLAMPATAQGTAATATTKSAAASPRKFLLPLVAPAAADSARSSGSSSDATRPHSAPRSPLTTSFGASQLTTAAVDMGVGVLEPSPRRKRTPPRPQSASRLQNMSTAVTVVKTRYGSRAWPANSIF